MTFMIPLEKTQTNEITLNSEEHEKYGVTIDPYTDYYFFTDGSGHKDKIGGFCGIIYDVNKKQQYTVFGGQTETTTFRQEFKALLECFQFIFQNDKRKNLIINHYTDSESLSKSVNNEYGRNSNLDLWYLFSFFEQYYHLTTNYVSRNTPCIQLADTHASFMRETIKQYKEAIEL